MFAPAAYLRDYQFCRFTVGDTFLASQALSTHWWHRWGDLAIVFGFYLGSCLLLVLALRFISFAAKPEPVGKDDVSGRLEAVRQEAAQAQPLRREGTARLRSPFGYSSSLIAVYRPH